MGRVHYFSARNTDKITDFDFDSTNRINDILKTFMRMIELLPNTATNYIRSADIVFHPFSTEYGSIE